MAEREHPFPMKEPDVTVTPRPDADLKEILRADAGGFFVPLAVGAEVKWSFYDWPERQLTNVSHTRVAGIVKYGGEDCLEIIDRIIAGADEGWIGRWLYVHRDEALEMRLFERRDASGGAMIEEISATPQPLRLAVGMTWTGHEVYRCGSEQRGTGETHHGLIDGPFEVLLPAGGSMCLRETWWTRKQDGRGHTLAELYVADSARTIYFRRFNGPAWHNYDQLAGNPEREHDGVIWRLWYECLPDIALAPSGKP